MIDLERVGYLVDLLKKALSDSYLLGFNNKTYVVVFNPEKIAEIKTLLEKNCATCEGICYYFFGFSVVIWEDVYDVIGFKGESVCCVEIFEGKEINKEFYWRYKENAVGKIKR
jgi:hypothetical protein